jgi:hypothetical protein
MPLANQLAHCKTLNGNIRCFQLPSCDLVCPTPSQCRLLESHKCTDRTRLAQSLYVRGIAVLYHCLGPRGHARMLLLSPFRLLEASGGALKDSSKRPRGVGVVYSVFTGWGVSQSFKEGQGETIKAVDGSQLHRSPKMHAKATRGHCALRLSTCTGTPNCCLLAVRTQSVASNGIRRSTKPSSGDSWHLLLFIYPIVGIY